MGSQLFKSEKINREGERELCGGERKQGVERAFDFLAK